MKKLLLTVLMVIGVSVCVFAEEINNIDIYKNAMNLNNNNNSYKKEAKRLNKTLMYYKKVDKNNLYWKYRIKKDESKNGIICGTIIGSIIGDLLQSKQNQTPDQIMINNKIK